MTFNHGRYGERSDPVRVAAQLRDGRRDEITVVAKPSEVETARASFSEEIGLSEFDKTELKNGGNITISRFIPPEDMTMELEPHEPDMRLNSLLLFAGQTELSYPRQQPYILNPDQGYNFRYLGEPIRYQLPGRKLVHALGICLPPAVFELYLDNDVPEPLRPLLDAPETDYAFTGFRLPVKMRNTLLTAAQPGLTGTFRQIQLEGVALLFLSMIVQAMDCVDKTGKRQCSATERTAAEEAYAILRDNLQAPPTLGDLAKSVGLTDKRLNVLFRELFGATVFEALRNMRLEQARSLLLDGEKSIKEIAWQVGYAHVSNFSLAFVAKFGLPPAAARLPRSSKSESSGPD